MRYRRGMSVLNTAGPPSKEHESMRRTRGKAGRLGDVARAGLGVAGGGRVEERRLHRHG